MKCSKTKTIPLFLIGSALLGLSMAASADDLKLSNDSKYDLSFSINNICSQEFGVLDAHSVKIIPEASFKKVCESNCDIKVYNSASCAGKQIAMVEFDTKSGVTSLHPIEFTVKSNGFNLFFEGPWLVK